MRKKLETLLVWVVLAMSVVQAQDSCPALVDQALAAVGTACAATERNQACYGNIAINATGRTPAFTFAQVGDIVNVRDIERMQLSPFDLAKNEWGVVLMNVQATLPDTFPGQGVRVLFFGDVQVAGDDAHDLTNGFYFTSGVSDSPCKGVPNSGILVQTPEGVGKVTLNINNVSISLGSTAFLQAQAGAQMTVALLEGAADITADGVTVALEPGFWVGVPLDADGRASGAPNEPESFELEEDAPLTRVTQAFKGDAEMPAGDSVIALGEWLQNAQTLNLTCQGFTVSVPVEPIRMFVVTADTTQIVFKFAEGMLMEGMPISEAQIVFAAAGDGRYVTTYGEGSVAVEATLLVTSSTSFTLEWSVTTDGSTCDIAPVTLVYRGS